MIREPIPDVIADCMLKGCQMGELRAEIERLKAALQVCSADWISAPGTVMGAAQSLSAEFRRRMEIAAAALEPRLAERLRDIAGEWADAEIREEAAAEIERLRALKTPASRELLNITKGCLDSAEAEVERLRADLGRLHNAYAEQNTTVKELRAEIERLSAQNTKLEIKRLRAALEPKLERELRAEIEHLRKEVETWRDAYEAEHQDHEATMKAWDAERSGM